MWETPTWYIDCIPHNIWRVWLCSLSGKSRFPSMTTSSSTTVSRAHQWYSTHPYRLLFCKNKKNLSIKVCGDKQRNVISGGRLLALWTIIVSVWRPIPGPNTGEVISFTCHHTYILWYRKTSIEMLCDCGCVVGDFSDIRKDLIKVLASQLLVWFIVTNLIKRGFKLIYGA